MSVSRTRTRVGAALAAVLTIAGLVGVGLSDRIVVPHAPDAPVAQVQAQPSEISVACPPGIVDPISTRPIGHASRWSSVDEQWREPVAIVQRASGTDTPVPSGVTVAAQGGGELRGVITAGCSLPVTDQWFAVGSTTVGQDMVLMLTNPSTKPSIAHLSALSSTGPVADDWTVDVPAGETVVALPATQWIDQSRLAIRIQADGSPIAAWAQRSSMIGEVPTGLAQTPSTQPATTHVLLGTTTGGAGSVLRLATPGTVDAHIRVQVGPVGGTLDDLPGTQDLTVAAGTALDVTLEGLPDDAGHIQVTSDQPVVAQATMQEEGAPWAAGGETPWGATTVVNPSLAVVAADLPGGEGLADTLTQQLGTTPQRPTGAPTPSGLVEGSAVSMQVLLSNPASRAATVRLGATSLTIPAHASAITDLPETAQTLRSSLPINAALLVGAQLHTGTVHATWPLGLAGMSAQSLSVRNTL